MSKLAAAVIVACALLGAAPTAGLAAADPVT
jgi:hypothetical protein